MLKGSPIKRHLKDIRAVMNETDRSKFDSLIRQRLTHILKHAYSTTAFYANVDWSLGINGFPVIDKNIIREKTESFLSSNFSDQSRIPAITSGSTGTPFKTYQHQNKKHRNTADTLYFASLAGYKLGKKLYYFKIWSNYNNKSSLLQKIQNIVPVDVLNLKVNAHKTIKELNTNKHAVSFLGYVSAFETLCKVLEKESTWSLKVKVASIITMSEGLNEYTKTMGQKFFNCPVLSRYSNIENGIIAQQTITNQFDFTINQASYYLEIMDMQSNKVLPHGQLGRIIVTDFFNEAMPLIRYDTGDLGIIDTRIIDGAERLVLSKIEGRKLDQIFNTKGDLISSYIVYKNMWKYTEIEQYQLIQKSKNEYIFRIAMTGDFSRENELTMEFLEYLGTDADFKIEHVKEIPLLDSGKRRKVVNEMNKMNK